MRREKWRFFPGAKNLSVIRLISALRSSAEVNEELVRQCKVNYKKTEYNVERLTRHRCAWTRFIRERSGTASTDRERDCDMSLNYVRVSTRGIKRRLESWTLSQAKHNRMTSKDAIPGRWTIMLIVFFGRLLLEFVRHIVCFVELFL
jgi:hypothetical protein